MANLVNRSLSGVLRRCLQDTMLYRNACASCTDRSTHVCSRSGCSRTHGETHCSRKTRLKTWDFAQLPKIYFFIQPIHSSRSEDQVFPTVVNRHPRARQAKHSRRMAGLSWAI